MGIEVIGAWRILGEPETGRTGRVFVVCRENDPSRQYVLKLLRDDQPGLPRDVNEKEAERLRTTKAPQRMPKLIETGVWHGLPFFVMEKLEGVDYPIPEKMYRAFCVEAFAALDEVHRAKIVHGDLTPGHLVQKAGRLSFIDFDASLSFDEAIENKDCLGTDPYIAPEVASRGLVSVQSDLYSLAMILVERCPHRLRDCFEPVLSVCLRPNPTERPRDAAEVAQVLRTCRPPHHRFKAIVKWTTSTLGAVVIFVLINRYVDSVRAERDYRQRSRERLDVKSLVWDGCVDYLTGNMESAKNRLGRAIRSPCFKEGDFPEVDVRDMYKDACRLSGNKLSGRADEENCQMK